MKDAATSLAEPQHSAAEIVKRLPAGARRALLKMTDDWQFAGRYTFNANGAWSLHWTRGLGGRGILVEMANLPSGKHKRSAYRLTPLGMEARAHAAIAGEG